MSNAARCTKCKALVVRLRANNGDDVYVDAGTVQPGDTTYNHTRHTKHSKTCVDRPPDLSKKGSIKPLEGLLGKINTASSFKNLDPDPTL